MCVCVSANHSLTFSDLFSKVLKILNTHLYHRGTLCEHLRVLFCCALFTFGNLGFDLRSPVKPAGGCTLQQVAMAAADRSTEINLDSRERNQLGLNVSAWITLSKTSSGKGIHAMYYHLIIVKNM